MQIQAKDQIVYTLSAKCRDCYRCLKACPVKAIKMKDGQAYVIKERCISCGTCIRECPQGAKAFRNDVASVKAIIASGALVAASIAPSFPAFYNEWERLRLASALRKLGFSFIGHTSQGAYRVARASVNFKNKKNKKVAVSTACPAFVGYIKSYAKEHLPSLCEVLSPMHAHAAMLKQQFGDSCKVVFIGPCIAKKAELEWDENAGRIHAALTFRELDNWLKEENVELKNCAESSFDEPPAGIASLFPLSGGMLKTAGLDSESNTSSKFINPAGLKNSLEAIAWAVNSDEDVFIEPLFCNEGCINGPGAGRDVNTYEKRQRLSRFAACSIEAPEGNTDDSLLEMKVRESGGSIPKETDPEKVREALLKVGKITENDHLNCGACGYNTCREKAEAVVLGMAEAEMCIPWMRRLAEQRTDKIIETSPNGILILDKDLVIINMNASFRSYFNATDAVYGRHISYLMDPKLFEKVASGSADKIEGIVNHSAYNLVMHQIVYSLKEEKQFVGIFVDITSLRMNEKKLDKIKEQTITQAKELLEHQIKMAHEMAILLGKNTAKGEEIVSKLMSFEE